MKQLSLKLWSSAQAPELAKRSNLIFGGAVISKKALGDAHNFHRRVSYFEKAGEAFIEKPRCIFWEYLFLDKTSPLRCFLKNLKGDVDFDALLGDLKISTDDDFSTGVAQFVTETAITDETEWLSGYGELLGLVSVFGITDLHRENVLNIENRPRLIDIECLFWGAELPSETFLLSKNAFEWSKSVWLSTRFSGLRTLGVAEVVLILKGYRRLLDCMLQHCADLANFFATIPFRSHPLRVLIERTRDYRAAMEASEVSLNLFLEEELTQMRRGDIPYFYGFSGQQDIYFFESETRPKVLSSRKPLVEEKLRRAFKTPEELLNVERLMRLKKQGIVEIVVRLLNPESLPFSSSEIKMFIENGFLKIALEDLLLQVKYTGPARG